MELHHKQLVELMYTQNDEQVYRVLIDHQQIVVVCLEYRLMLQVLINVLDFEDKFQLLYNLLQDLMCLIENFYS
jgi:hypothetical protein